MTAAVVIIAFVALCATAVGALICQQCKGSSCSDEEVVLVECNRNINKLPYGFESRAHNSVDFDYACLNLEYVEGVEILPLRQCYIVSPTEDLCGEISASLPLGVQLRTCTIRQNLLYESYDEGSSSTSSTTEDLISSGDTTSTTTEDTTTTTGEDTTSKDTTTTTEDTTSTQDTTTTSSKRTTTTTTEGTTTATNTNESSSQSSTLEPEPTPEGAGSAAVSLLVLASCILAQRIL